MVTIVSKYTCIRRKRPYPCQRICSHQIINNTVFKPCTQNFMLKVYQVEFFWLNMDTLFFYQTQSSWTESSRKTNKENGLFSFIGLYAVFHINCMTSIIWSYYIQCYFRHFSLADSFTQSWTRPDKVLFKIVWDIGSRPISNSPAEGEGGYNKTGRIFPLYTVPFQHMNV